MRASLLSLALLACAPEVVTPAAPAVDDEPRDAIGRVWRCGIPAYDLRPTDVGGSVVATAYPGATLAGCRVARLDDALVRFRAPTAGRWMLRADGDLVASLAVRDGCDDADALRACRTSTATSSSTRRAPWMVVVGLARGEEVLVAVNGCSASTTCHWRVSAMPAPDDAGPCVRGTCPGGHLCARLPDEALDAEPRCVRAMAPDLGAVVLEVGDGIVRARTLLTDLNGDAADVQVTLLDAGGAVVPWPARPVPVARGVVTQTWDSGYLPLDDARPVAAAVLVARDSTGLASQPARAVASPILRVRDGGFCDPTRRTALCLPGHCCWTHEGTVGVCRESCR